MKRRLRPIALKLARARIRTRKALGLSTCLALVATACLAIFANRLVADGAFLVVGVLAMIAAVGSASARRAR